MTVQHSLDIAKDYLPVWTAIGGAVTGAAAGWFAHVFRVREERVRQQGEINKLKEDLKAKLALADADRAEAKRQDIVLFKQQNAQLELVKKAADIYRDVLGEKPTMPKLLPFLYSIIESDFRSTKLLPFDAAGKAEQVTLQITMLVYEYVGEALKRAANRGFPEPFKSLFDSLCSGCNDVLLELRSAVKVGVVSDEEVAGVKLAWRALFSRDFPIPKAAWNVLNKDDRAVPALQVLSAALSLPHVEWLLKLHIKLELFEVLAGQAILADGMQIGELYSKLMAEAVKEQSADSRVPPA